MREYQSIDHVEKFVFGICRIFLLSAFPFFFLSTFLIIIFVWSAICVQKLHKQIFSTWSYELSETTRTSLDFYSDLRICVLSLSTTCVWRFMVCSSPASDWNWISSVLLVAPVIGSGGFKFLSFSEFLGVYKSLLKKSQTFWVTTKVESQFLSKPIRFLRLWLLTTPRTLDGVLKVRFLYL